jgi:hypothetical protein
MVTNDHTKIDFLYTNIGRGHPHYLDCIIEELPPDRVGTVVDVFSSRSITNRLAWRVVRAAYITGGKGGLWSHVYNQLRSSTDYDRPRLSRYLLGNGLAKLFAVSRPLIVAHPLLVALLRDRADLLYQHGEIVAPRESMVAGEHRIFVPLTRTADFFMAAGFSSNQIFVSGLCIEPRLVELCARAMDGRQERLAGSAPLCGAFFSSGSEPAAHVETIVAAASSIHGQGGRSLVFAQRLGRLEKEMRSNYRASNIELTTVETPTDVPSGSSATVLCLFTERQHLNEMTAALFPEFDYFVAPAHERTNWALGLGLPMYLLDPSLGRFAPLNRGVLLEAGVAKAINDSADAVTFAETVEAHRKSGELQEMSEAGWQRFDIRGFYNIAAMLESYA